MIKSNPLSAMQEHIENGTLIGARGPAVQPTASVLEVQLEMYPTDAVAAAKAAYKEALAAWKAADRTLVEATTACLTASNAYDEAVKKAKRDAEEAEKAKEKAARNSVDLD